jgi:hypothetical protein
MWQYNNTISDGNHFPHTHTHTHTVPFHCFTYLKVVVMGFVSQSLAIDGKCCYVTTFIVHDNDTFARHGDVLW